MPWRLGDGDVVQVLRTHRDDAGRLWAHIRQMDESGAAMLGWSAATKKNGTSKFRPAL